MGSRLKVSIQLVWFQDAIVSGILSLMRDLPVGARPIRTPLQASGTVRAAGAANSGNRMGVDFCIWFARLFRWGMIDAESYRDFVGHGQGSRCHNTGRIAAGRRSGIVRQGSLPRVQCPWTSSWRSCAQALLAGVGMRCAGRRVRWKNAAKPCSPSCRAPLLRRNSSTGFLTRARSRRPWAQPGRARAADRFWEAHNDRQFKGKWPRARSTRDGFAD